MTQPLRTSPTSQEEAVRRMAHADGWMLDVDGCLVRTNRAGGAGGELIDGAARLIDWLRRNQRQFVICTNASQKPVSAYAGHLREMGLDIADTEMMTAGSAAIDYIALHHPGARVQVVGDTGLTEAVQQHDLVLLAPDDPDADVVMVGSADHYTTANLNAACLAIADHNAAFYVAVNMPWFHGGKRRSIATSSAIAGAITSVTGVVPQVCGKPSEAIGEVLRERLGGKDSEIVIVGDMASIEVLLAHRMNAVGALVLSGGTREDELAGLPAEHQPHWFGADVGELVKQISQLVP